MAAVVTSVAGNTQTLVIIRGAPGHGKSTLAKSISSTRGYVHYEPDHYLDREEVKYGNDVRMDAAVRAEALLWCYAQVSKELGKGNSVVLSGLFTKINDLLPYYKLGLKHNLVIEVIERFRPEHRFKNVHGTPEYLVEKLISAFESLTTSEKDSVVIKKYAPDIVEEYA